MGGCEHLFFFATSVPEFLFASWMTCSIVRSMLLEGSSAPASSSARLFLGRSRAIPLCFAIFAHSGHLLHLHGHAECIAALKPCALHLRQNRLTFVASDGIMKFSGFLIMDTRKRIAKWTAQKRHHQQSHVIKVWSKPLQDSCFGKLLKCSNSSHNRLKRIH